MLDWLFRRGDSIGNRNEAERKMVSCVNKKIFGFMLFMLFISIHVYAIDGNILATVDYSIEDKWYKTAGESLPEISTVDSVVKGQDFFIGMMVNDYSIDGSRNADIAFDISIIDPDRKIYFDAKNLTVIKSKVNPKHIFLGQNLLKVNFESDKPAGKYTINVVLYDRVSNKSKKLSESIRLENYKNKKYFLNDDEFSRWLTNYYRKPSPEKSIDGFLYFTKSKLNEKESNFIPTFTFFLSVFNGNKYLVPEIVKLYREQDLKTRIYLIYLLRYVDYDAKSFLEGLQEQEKVVYDGIKNKPYSDNPYEKIVGGDQLDMLWSEFFATGGFKPVHRLIQALEYREYDGAMKKFKESKNPSVKDKQNAVYDLIYQAAMWSLRSNCQQHRLVRDYCSYVLQNIKVSYNITTCLTSILAE
jgi:hypothetical protein